MRSGRPSTSTTRGERMDERIETWAEQLVDYATDVKEGDIVHITYAHPGRALAKAVFRKVVERGAYPVTDLRDEEFDRLFYEHADDNQLGRVPAFEEDRVEQTDVQIKITAPRNTRELASVRSERMNRRKQARRHLRQHRIEQVRWCRTQFPSSGGAQDADMSMDAYRDFVFDACVKDWAQESERYLPLKDVVDHGSEVRIVTRGTDLSFSIGERDGINRVGVLSDGTRNVPGGEVFTTPHRESTEGEIVFDIPAVIDGKAVEDIHLVFEDGRVVEYGAARNEALLDDLFATDDETHYIGEFGIGTNFAIDRPTKNILFDEKIGGTIHLALGLAYPFCLQRLVDVDDMDRHGLDDDEFSALMDEAEEALRFHRFDRFRERLDDTERTLVDAFRQRWEAMDERVAEQVNRSAVHQDLITDLRDDGTLLIDGEVVMEDGSFVDIDTLP